jgi:hypothetical protein
MLGYPITELFLTGVRLLPRVFLIGAPVVVLLLSLTAVADCALPYTKRGDRSS